MDFNQIKSILKLRSCSRQPMESHVPHILSYYKIYLSKGVNILLGQPVDPPMILHASEYDSSIFQWEKVSSHYKDLCHVFILPLLSCHGNRSSQTNFTKAETSKRNTAWPIIISFSSGILYDSLLR